MRYNGQLYVEKGNKNCEEAIALCKLLIKNAVLSCEICDVDDKELRGELRDRFGSVFLPILDVPSLSTFVGYHSIRNYFSHLAEL